MKRIACFFTCGYTERKGMKQFLRKINPELNLNPVFPVQERRGRRPNQTDLIDGSTGEELLARIYQYLEQHPEKMKGCDAVLIEDDLDGKFYRERIPGDPGSRVVDKTPEYTEHCEAVRAKVREKAGRDETLPVILFHASPEVETWFLADWENSFGRVYQDLDVLKHEENQYFSTRFRPYLRREVLDGYQDEPERYGWFDGTYRKLSSEIIQSLEHWKIGLAEERTTFSRAVGLNDRLRYSKQTHGGHMLAELDPDSVQRNCPLFFREAYYALKKL